MTTRVFSLPIAACLMLAACDALPPDSVVPAPAQAEVSAETTPKTCWEKLVTPPVVDSATDQPAAETPKLTKFQTPCPADLPADFVASLQRALSARALYSGAITGKMNAGTSAAVRRYQAPEGIDSPTLSLAAARRLGLIAIELPED